jgi:predicted anti-sigma-YlaC factor YlaD
MQLDGELPEQDFDRVETHLRFCPECSAWAEQMRDVTLRLRDSRVEVPAGGFMPSRHTRRWRVGSAVALAAAAAVVAAMFVAPGQRLSVNSRNRQAAESRLASSETQTLAVSRLNRLEDGVRTPVATPAVVQPF